MFDEIGLMNSANGNSIKHLNFHQKLIKKFYLMKTFDAFAPAFHQNLLLVILLHWYNFQK